MIKRFIIVLLILIVIFGGIFGYKAFKGYEMKKFMSMRKFPPVTVTAASAKIGDWRHYIHAIGNVRAVNSVNVTTQVAGQVNGIYFKSGEFVRKNQILATLDDSLQLAQLKQLKSQLLLNKFNYEHYKKAYQKYAVSKASYVQMLSMFKQNEAQINQTEVAIDDMTIRAPFSGIVGIRNPGSVNLGQYINPGTSIIPLYSVNPIYIDYTMPQNDMDSLKTGGKVLIGLSSEPEVKPGLKKPLIGAIKAVSIDVNDVSRNITARVEANNSGLVLRPGMFVTGRFLLPVQHNVITVPATAITYNPYGNFVYLAVKRKGAYYAKTDYVKTGEERNGTVIITKGLKPGEEVVTSGQVKLKNGDPIKIEKTAGKESRKN